MSKKDLEARIAALEAEVAQLRLQVAQKQPGITIAPPYVYWDWYRPTVVWCGTSTSVKGTISLNADDSVLKLVADRGPTS